MKAVVLVGGEGTRLRPLTDTMPKPLIPLVDRPILAHVLDHLVRHGVGEVVLSSSYLEPTFHAFLEERHGHPAIAWITEAEPLGTGGAIVNALEALDDTGPFLALNGDILTDLDLTAMLETHRARAAVATIALTHVDDARPYGLVPLEPDGRVIEFREKPAEVVPGYVNAGTYVLEPSALEGWQRGRTVSIEREIFPKLIADGATVVGFPSEAYWRDLGTPESYLDATFDLLDGRVGGAPAYGDPFVAEGAHADRAGLRGHVVVRPRATVEAGAEVEASVVLESASVGARARVGRSIVGPGAVVEGAVADSVVGAGARIGPGVSVEGDRVPPGERRER